jgi:hypothetical protein
MADFSNSPMSPKHPGGMAELAAPCTGLAVLMVILSAAGILFRIDLPVIAIATSVAAAIGVATGAIIGSWRPAMVLAWLAIAAGFLVIPFFSTVSPPYSWDEVAYSVAFPKLYAATGHIFYSNDIGAYSAFPSSYEALTTASLAVTGSVIPMRVLGVVCFLAMGGIAAHLARLVEPRKSAAFLAGILVVSAGVGSFSFYIKNDFANGVFSAAAILFVCAYLRRESSILAALAGMSLGISCGIKYNSLQFVVCAVLCLVPFAWQSASGTARWRHFAIFCAAGVTAGIAWYARNFAIFGNPLYPFGISVFGDGTANPKLLAAFVHEAFFGYAGYSFGTADLSVFWDGLGRQFGWLTLLLATIGLVRVAVTSRDWSRQYRRPASYLMAVTVTYSAVCLFFGLWLPRYFVVLLVCYAALAAAALGWMLGFVARLCGRARFIHIGLACLMAIGLLTEATERWWRESAWLVSGVLAGVSQKTFIASSVNFWNVAEWINTTLPLCSKVAIGLDVQPYYYVDRRYYVFTLIASDFLAARTTEDFEQRFRDLGFTHLALQDWIARDLYPEATDPNVNRFINGLYAAVNRLEAEGRAIRLGEVDGIRGNKVRFYRLVNGNDPEKCSSADRQATGPSEKLGR